MTSKQVYEATAIELSKVQAPSLKLYEFNYFFNQAIRQYVNKVYNIYDTNQQTTDDLRVLKVTTTLSPKQAELTGNKAIENCFLIAPSRFAKGADGNYLIDGTPDIVSNSSYGTKSRYGRAELYVEKPGLEAEQKVTRAKLELQATNYIYQYGYEDWLTFAKVLGRNMENQPVPDVEYFLISVAKKTPEKIIEICSGGDLANRVLFITAKENGVIRKRNGMYTYGEDGDLILGASEEAVIDWMRQPKNKKTLELIRKDAYPDLHGVD